MAPMVDSGEGTDADAGEYKRDDEGTEPEAIAKNEDDMRRRGGRQRKLIARAFLAMTKAPVERSIGAFSCPVRLAGMRQIILLAALVISSLPATR